MSLSIFIYQKILMALIFLLFHEMFKIIDGQRQLEENTMYYILSNNFSCRWHSNDPCNRGQLLLK